MQTLHRKCAMCTPAWPANPVRGSPFSGGARNQPSGSQPLNHPFPAVHFNAPGNTRHSSVDVPLLRSSP
jgi:hypothetical protein